MVTRHRLSADGRVLGAAASGTLLSLVSFTAPLATINPISGTASRENPNPDICWVTAANATAPAMPT